MIRAALAAVLLFGCSEPFAPVEDDWTPYSPPAAFATFWAEMEACTGLSRDFAGVRWFTAESLEDYYGTGGTTTGAYYHPDVVVIRQSVVEARFAPVILHEIIHALDAHRDLWSHTEGGPVEYFPSYDAWFDCTRHFDTDFANNPGW